MVYQHDDMLTAQLLDEHWHELQQALIRSGWSLGPQPAIASKTYETACAPKTAHMYFGRGWLCADYQSEGRNALSTTSLEIRHRDRAALHGAVMAFAKQLDDNVDATYARSLWLLGVRPRPVVFRPAPTCRCQQQAPRG